MKLAIIGSSPLALEAAIRFHAHEASVSWFCAEEGAWGPIYERCPMDWEHCTSELGKKILHETGVSSFEKEGFSWQKWKTHYQMPLMEVLKVHQNLTFHPVISITKRYLAPGEQIEGKERFFDLFRLIYQMNPETFINQQRESAPETFERLSEELIQSLQSSLEMYEDFDLVLDLRMAWEPKSLAVTGRALGEGRIKDKVTYGEEVIQKASDLCTSTEIRELALIGSDALAAEVLIQLAEWLQDPRSRLFVIGHELDPFANFLRGAKDELKSKLSGLFASMEREFYKEGELFQQKLREWQALDDFVQVKYPRPAEPIPRLVFFSAHNVTAIDQLIDKRRIFLTLEKPEFRTGIKHPENNHLDLKTIGVDEVLVATGSFKKKVANGLMPDEMGFFEIIPHGPTMKNAWKEDLNAINKVEKEIFKLFSPAGPHRL